MRHTAVMGVVATACVAVVSAPMLGSMARTRHHAERSFDHLRRMSTVDLLGRGMSGDDGAALDLAALDLVSGDLKSAPAIKVGSGKTSGDGAAGAFGPSPGSGGVFSGLATGAGQNAAAPAAPAAKQALLDASTTESPFSPPAASVIPASFASFTPRPPTPPDPPPQPPEQPQVTPDPITTPIVEPPIEVVVTLPQPPPQPGAPPPPPGGPSIGPPTGPGLPPVTPVPEPSTWAMMVIGFAAIALAIRRRHGLRRGAA